MINQCLFCKIPFTGMNVIKESVVEGHTVTNLECSNCGAKFKNVMVIERSPTQKHVVNIRKNEEQKEKTDDPTAA